MAMVIGILIGERLVNHISDKVGMICALITVLASSLVLKLVAMPPIMIYLIFFL